MNTSSRQYVAALTAFLKAALELGLEKAAQQFPAEPGDLEPPVDALAAAASAFIAQLLEAHGYYVSLAEGNLSFLVDRHAYLAMPAKAIQADLRHLTWQIQRIADGDLRHKVRFLGEFSEAFDALIAALRDKRELEAQVRMDGERLATMTSVLADGVLVTDSDERITFCNPEACRLLDRDESELIGLSFHQTIHTHDADGSPLPPEALSLRSAMLRNQTLRRPSLLFNQKAGTQIPVSASFAPMHREATLSGAVIAFRDISRQLAYEASLHALNRKLAEQANRDTLTGLRNRQYFDRKLAREIERHKRYGTSFSLSIFDIDHFKQINDHAGHLAGDACLRKLAELIQSNVRQLDCVARWGGEEFIWLLPNSESTAAYQAAEKLRRSFDAHSFPQALHLTCSFGVAQYRTDETAESLIARADKALYVSKEQGRNRTTCD